MCGICGSLGDLSLVNSEEMSKALRHRGPDDEGSYEARLGDGRVLRLANRRLSILDLSLAGHQPMSSADGRFVIAFNGEVYNFREVADELRSRGVIFRGGSDTEVVVNAWREWGADCLSRLRGMFAFAVYDTLEERLFLARDRLGEKPLYYWSDGQTFLFASEVRAILASGVVERVMSSDGLDSFLTFGSVADPYTMVEGVTALEPGHVCEVVDGRPVARPYWSLADIREQTDGVSASEAALRTGELLRDACRLAMESDVPVGVLLSGGIDSSSTVVMLKELGFHNLSTFSVTFPGQDEGFSEERWSSLVSQRFGTDHTSLSVGVDEAKAWVGEGIMRQDQPSIDGMNTYVVTRAIGTAGIKVALSGAGGDELFLGYPYREAFPLLSRIGRVRIPSAFRAIVQPLRDLNWVAETKREKFLQLLLGSDDPYLAAYVAIHAIFSQGGLERLRGRARPSQVRFVRDQGGTSKLGRLSRLELAYYLRNTLLRDGDQMSMANSVELRQPFLDSKVVEEVVSLPTGLKVRKGAQKPLLVDAVGRALPREVVSRPKMGFELPYRRWMMEGLRAGDPMEVSMGLDLGEISAVRQRFDNGSNWTRYWALQVLASWVGLNGIKAY